MKNLLLGTCALVMIGAFESVAMDEPNKPILSGATNGSRPTEIVAPNGSRLIPVKDHKIKRGKKHMAKVRQSQTDQGKPNEKPIDARALRDSKVIMCYDRLLKKSLEIQEERESLLAYMGQCIIKLKNELLKERAKNSEISSANDAMRILEEAYDRGSLLEDAKKLSTDYSEKCKGSLADRLVNLVIKVKEENGDQKAEGSVSADTSGTTE